MPAAFQIQTAKNGKFYFNLTAANGEIVLTSQMYSSKQGARRGAASVQANCGEQKQYEERQNKGGRHFFVLKARNGQIIGTSQGYSSAAAMRKGIQSVSRSAPKAKVVDES